MAAKQAGAVWMMPSTITTVGCLIMMLAIHWMLSKPLGAQVWWTSRKLGVTSMAIQLSFVNGVQHGFTEWLKPQAEGSTAPVSVCT